MIVRTTDPMVKKMQKIKKGMTKEEVIKEFGEPEKIQYISCSFRPPHENEDINDYRKEEEEWKKNNAGERWIYFSYSLRVDFNFMGVVLDWKRLR